MLVVLLLMPMASAQVTYDLQLEAGTLEDRIRPDVDQVPIDVTWSLSCEPGGTDMATTEETALRFDVTVPQGIVANGGATVVVPPPDCAGTPSSGTATFILAATRHAPGLQPLTVLVAGNMTIDTAVPTSLADSTSTGLEVAYVGLVQATLHSSIQQGTPGTTSDFAMTLTNVGNAASRVVLATDDDGFTVPDAPVVAPGETANVTVGYRHPDSTGYDNSEATGRITVTPVAEANGEEGTPVTLNVLARTRSDVLAPGPGPWVAIALVATAWVARRIC